MKAWFPLLKARTALIIWATLAVAGALPVLAFVAIVIWQLATLFQTRAWVPLPATLLFAESLLPAHPAAIWVLSRVQAGLLPALLGLGLVAIGVLGVRSRRAAILAHRQYREDALRRVQDYRRDDSMADTLDGRREPFIATAPATPVPRRAGAQG
jgi:hypothetical protein